MVMVMDLESRYRRPRHFFIVHRTSINRDELMVDPVELPSGTNLNRPTAERICMSDGMDPYTRQPVTMADLKPNDELRERVLKFAKDNNIKITQLG